ncbi:monooxygenase [Mycobacterium intracellulare]|uniref:MmoB/DmpM family protein n=1 Tax=Mycobacterium intracellulare TaxID=1767 RepID=UPI000BAAC6C3|nr:MmoB/DmpM family protein [Mycobacterium intracellulare]ASW96789.1 monooxygenase [Mycobacterium intracellulare]PBA19526.1 monooxygenase [Mycobacterium intracellulare]
MTEARTRRIRNVGVDLQDTDEARPLVDAIERDNPDAEVRRMPGMLKITVAGHLVIRRTTVEELLGRPWETHEFQMAIISLVGNIAEWDEDEILIKWDR